MAYSKTTWSSGDTITAAKLNNMESGISDNADDIATINQSLSDLLSVKSLTASGIQCEIIGDLFVHMVLTNVNISSLETFLTDNNLWPKNSASYFCLYTKNSSNRYMGWFYITSGKTVTGSYVGSYAGTASTATDSDLIHAVFEFIKL